MNKENLIKKVKPFVEMQNAFENEISDYTGEKYGFGEMVATNDYLMLLIKNSLKGMSEAQLNTISYLLDCARNYEFFVEKKEKGEWDNLIAKYGENRASKRNN